MKRKIQSTPKKPIGGKSSSSGKGGSSGRVKRQRKNKDQKATSPVKGTTPKTEIMDFVGENKREYARAKKEGTLGAYNEWQSLRRTKMMEMYLEGFSQRRIAEVLEVDLNTIIKEMKIIREEWKEHRLQYMDRIKEEELAKIDHLENILWVAWQRSCQLKETHKERMTFAQEAVKKVKKKKVGSGSPALRPKETIRETITENRDGDPRYLEQIAGCIQLRLKLCGLLGGPNQGQGDKVTINIDWSGMANPQQAKRVEVIEQPQRVSPSNGPLNLDLRSEPEAHRVTLELEDPIEERIRRVEAQSHVMIPNEEFLGELRDTSE